MKKIFSFIILIIFILFFELKSNGAGKISLKLENEPRNIGDVFEITLQTSNLPISALQIELHFDENKIKCISEEDNNLYIMQNQVNYLWYNNGLQNSQSNANFITFSFQLLELGDISVGINGKAYNENGEEVNVDFEGINFNVGNQISDYVITSEENSQNEEKVQVSKDNAYLKNLRINQEGIEPDFKNDVYDYYFVTENQNLEYLEITAIPENENSEVIVTGNTNLKNGLNQIKIEVVSEDKTNKKIYNLWVTKTSNLQIANANLETLAIEGFDLNPEFQSNVLEYKVEVGKDIESVKILAIPENSNAKVSKSDSDSLIVGDNYLNIIVTAEDGFTKKTYKIVIHRRNDEEESLYEEKKEENQEKLGELLSVKEESKNENNIEEDNNKEQKSEKNGIFVELLMVLIIIALIIGMWRFLENRKNVKNNMKK